MMVTPVAKVPSALRKSRGSIGELSLDSSLAGSGTVGCFEASFIQRASKRQVIGRQAQRNPSVIGACRVEIERNVRIDRGGITKLPLQRARRGEAPGAARRKQQRHGFRA